MARSLIPNSTQIPDVILDRWLSKLSGAEIKVVLYIARRTFGFGKDRDNISLRQICTGIRKRDGKVIDTGTGLSRPGAVKAIKALEERGIILRTHNHREHTGEFEENTYSLNLTWTGNEEEDEPESGSSTNDGGTGVVNCVNYPGNREGRGWSTEFTTGGKSSSPGVVNRVNPQETDQETDQETAARRTAAAEALELKENGPDLHHNQTLVDDLVRAGLNRDAAFRLACADPDECRRQLEFTRYASPADFEKGRGAYLAVAIPKKFGPHATFTAAMRRGETEKRRQAQSMAVEARKRAEETRRASLTSEAREWLRQLEEEHLEVFTAFQEYAERDLQGMLAALSSPKARETITRDYQSPERQVELLARFFKRSECPLEGFERWFQQQVRRPTTAAAIPSLAAPVQFSG